MRKLFFTSFAHLRSVANCLLPIAYCLLPIAFCLLPIAFCLLPIASSAQEPLKGRDESIKGPQSFAIVVGVSHYKYIRPLAYADKDAELFRDWLRSPAGGKLKNDNIFCLLNDQANNSNFWGKGFQWLKKKDLQKGDKLFIYLAGHGDAIDEDQYFFLGYDCKPDGDKNNYLVSGAIQLFNLKKKIAKETSKGVDVVFIMDACRSNELPGGTDGQNFLNTAVSQKQTGEIMMLATAAGQESVEDASIGSGHGLFTWYLVDGLTGLADVAPKDNKISFSEISTYVDTNVHSLALERFKRKQDPYFCCNENSSKIVSSVDTSYLEQWQRIKKQQEKRSGRNSFPENDFVDVYIPVDTALIETYNRFNRAVKNNRINGNESAEFYFRQLNTKYPGNPYTLDAKSTLAVEWLDAAQVKVNRYLDCTTDISVNDKQANFEAAINLEKAIASFREDDEDFANSLYGRLYLLKASGDFGPNRANGEMRAALSYAYSGLAFDPGGAYILNRLAQLHLQNNNRDSALYYSNKAVKIAPGWACALTTLALIQQSAQNNVDVKKKIPVKKPSSFGLVVGVGSTMANPAFSENPNTLVTSAEGSSKFAFHVGLVYHASISSSFSFRPSVTLDKQSSAVTFQRRNPAGGNLITETVKIKENNLRVSTPVIFYLYKKKIAPYLVIGPSFNLLLSQDDTSKSKLPLKSSMSADIGLGMDIHPGKSSFTLSPELKFSYGLTDKKKAVNTIYANSLSALKSNAFTLSFYLRK